MIGFLREQYRHDKPLLIVGSGRRLVDAAAIPSTLPNGEADPGLIVTGTDGLNVALTAFEKVLAQFKVYQRETDPPRV